jgi:aminoglycoside phosphotransferase (APT) family kinase protein
MTYSPAPLEREIVLSPEWLGRTLGVPVRSVSVTETLTTIASKIRFRVEYGGPQGDLPDAMCVKAYFDEPARASLGQLEARFYRELAPLLGLRVPRCLHTGIDPETGHGLVLMTDLVVAGARFLTALSPYSVDDVARTLEQLARMHAVDPARTAPPDDKWLAPRLTGYLDYVNEERLQQQLDDGRAVDLAPGTRSASRLREAFAALAARATTAPAHYIHGDAHAGNLYIDADGQPGLIDWQVVQRGPWELDVAYHLVAVLDVPDRERSEADLLKHYLDAVRAHGGQPPSFTDAWDAYRDALAYGYFMWAITQRVERRIIDTFMTRLGSAVQAHETLDRLTTPTR